MVSCHIQTCKFTKTAFHMHVTNRLSRFSGKSHRLIKHNMFHGQLFTCQFLSDSTSTVQHQLLKGPFAHRISFPLSPVCHCPNKVGQNVRDGQAIGQTTQHQLAHSSLSRCLTSTFSSDLLILRPTGVKSAKANMCLRSVDFITGPPKTTVDSAAGDIGGNRR